jgi:hypothetical protein
MEGVKNYVPKITSNNTQEDYPDHIRAMPRGYPRLWGFARKIPSGNPPFS